MATNVTSNLNYLQPTSFKLVIDRENYPNLEYFCQNFTHPGMIINSVEVPFRKIAGVPFIGNSLTFNELNATIILDEDMTAYNEMYSWIEILHEYQHIPILHFQFYLVKITNQNRLNIMSVHLYH